MNLHSDGPTLTTACGFCHIYDGPKKQFPLNHLEHPVSELVYSRSDYDGRRWWTTWHHGGEERIVPELAEEIDQFTEALLQLPELETLDTTGQKEFEEWKAQRAKEVEKKRSV